VEALEADVPGQKAQDGQKDTEDDEDAWSNPFAPALYRIHRQLSHHTDGVKSTDYPRAKIWSPSNLRNRNGGAMATRETSGWAAGLVGLQG